MVKRNEVSDVAPFAESGKDNIVLKKRRLEGITLSKNSENSERQCFNNNGSP